VDTKGAHHDHVSIGAFRPILPSYSKEGRGHPTVLCGSERGSEEFTTNLPIFYAFSFFETDAHKKTSVVLDFKATEVFHFLQFLRI
jgi:hypothetical protein